MSSDADAGRFTHQTIDRRTVAEIQRKIVKWRKRNAASRLFHAKNDKEKITTWRLDLNRILHLFNVRSITSARLLLTVRLFRPSWQLIPT